MSGKRSKEPIICRHCGKIVICSRWCVGSNTPHSAGDGDNGCYCCVCWKNWIKREKLDEEELDNYRECYGDKHYLPFLREVIANAL